MQFFFCMETHVFTKNQVPNPSYGKNPRKGRKYASSYYFQHPRAGESCGRTQLSFVIEDFVLIFDYLVNECEVGPNHVVIRGHSIGGYFGVFGAAAIQKSTPQLKSYS